MPVLGRKTKARRSPSPGQNWREILTGELKKTERLFILGIGNRQKADDGAGSVCVRLLQKEIHRHKPNSRIVKTDPCLQILKSKIKNRLYPNLRILDAGEVPESVTGIIREFRPTHVLVVDAAVGGYEPGTVFLINKKRISRDDLSTHRIPLSYLVKYLEESIRCRVILLGIEPKVISWRKTVSPTVNKSIRALAGELLEILEGQRSILP